MVAFEPSREGELKYRYLVPSFQEINDFLNTNPTLVTLKTKYLVPGAVIVDANVRGVWVTMDVINHPNGDVDVHWVLLTSSLTRHCQQLFHEEYTNSWAAYIFELKPGEDYCPHCNIKLEHVNTADRCPSCWWLKPWW